MKEKHVARVQLLIGVLILETHPSDWHVFLGAFIFLVAIGDLYNERRLGRRDFVIFAVCAVFATIWTAIESHWFKWLVW